MNISVIGLGKLGSVMAAVLADKGNTVQGVDVNPRTVEAINAGRAPVQEPGLDELIRKNHHRLTATADESANMVRAVIETEHYSFDTAPKAAPAPKTPTPEPID